MLWWRRWLRLNNRNAEAVVVVTEILLTFLLRFNAKIMSFYY